MAKLDLVLNGKPFEIAKTVLARTCNFLDLNEDIWEKTRYEVRSAVSSELFREFLQGLERNTEMIVTTANAASLSLLAAEFGKPDLSTETTNKFTILGPESISALGERLFNLELEIHALRENGSDLPSGPSSEDRSRSSPYERLPILSAIPHFDEQVLIHERQLEALSFRLSEHAEFVSETWSTFLDLKSEVTLKCEELIRDVGVMNSRTNASVVSQCEDLLSQLYVEIENVKSWTSSELSSKLGDLRSQIDGEMENVKSFTTSELSSKCRDLHSRIDREIGNLRSWMSSEVEAQYGGFRSDIDGEIGNMKSWTSYELSSKCGDLRLHIDRELETLASWMTSEVEGKSEDLRSHIAREIGNMKSWVSSEVNTECDEVRSHIDREIWNLKSWTSSEVEGNCQGLRLQSAREKETLELSMSSKIEARCGEVRSQTDQSIVASENMLRDMLVSECKELRRVFSLEGQECENRLKNDVAELRETVTELQERFRQIESSTRTLASCAGSSVIPPPTVSADSVPCSTPPPSSGISDSSPSASAQLDVEPYAASPIQFPMKFGEPLNGIISHLSRKYGGNVHEKGIVAITSSSFYAKDTQYSAKHLGDPSSACLFSSEYRADQWVQWDFIERRVIPTDYSIQTHGDPPNSSHLKSWVIEGSIDGSSWTELDRRTNNHHLNGPALTGSFSISKSRECRLVRFRQTGKNHANSDVIVFYHFELFGSLRECQEISSSSTSPPASISTSWIESSTGAAPSWTKTEITMNSARPLDGILSHLSRKHGGNIHEKGIVTITSSSIYDDDPHYSATNLADPNSGCIFNSKDEVNQWVQWDFHELQVNPTNYSIQSHCSPAEGSHLKSWVVEGSIDGLNWTELDCRTNNGDLNGSLVIYTFSIAKSIECRFIRLRQTGENHRTDNLLAFSHFELFGIIRTSGETCDSSATPIPSVPVLHSSTFLVDRTLTEIGINSVRPLDGIISYLSRKHGGNVHEKGIVTVTSSSIFGDDPECSAKNLADPDTRCIFTSKGAPGQWAQWDFHGMRVIPTHYAIQTHHGSRGSSHLKSWVLEGSIDGLGWTELGRETGNDDLNDSIALQSFSIARSSECRFVRVRQIGTNHVNTDSLAFSYLELFGSLSEGLDTRDSPLASLRSVYTFAPVASSNSVLDRTITEIAMNSVNPLSGILSYLSRKRGGHVHNKGIVTIASSSVFRDDQRYSSRNLASPNIRAIFCSKNEVAQWVQWDFHNMRVIPTEYSIQTHNSPSNDSHLKSWMLGCSIDGSQWAELDHHTDTSELNGPLLIRSFQISKSVECRFIRLQHTGKNHANNDVLAFYHFELFGCLGEFPETSSSSVPPINPVVGSIRGCSPTRASSVAPIRSVSPSIPISSLPSVVIDTTRTEIAMNSVLRFDGIFSHLSQKHAGNIHEKGIVTITSSSVFNDDATYYATNLANWNTRLIFRSKDKSDQWVQWHFHSLRVNPTRYLIQTHGSPRNSFHLKSWVLEGSIDSLSWTELDRRTNNDDLNFSYWAESFSISKSIECHFIRLRHTDRNHMDNNILAFCNFEIFGSIRECTPTSTSHVAPIRSVSPSLPISSSPSIVIDPTRTEIAMNSTRPLDGLLSYLSRKYGGNIHEKGIVTITSSSVYANDSQYSPQNLVDPSPGRFFCSSDGAIEWVQWDFHGIRVSPSHYSIQTHNSPVGSAHLKSWVVEGSVDGLNWIELDRRPNNYDLNRPVVIRSFSVSKSTDCRFIRLQQTGPNHRNDNNLVFSYLELFGTFRTLCEMSNSSVTPMHSALISGSSTVGVTQMGPHIRMDSTRPLDGILSHLLRKYDGTIFVTITASSVYSDDSRYWPSNIINSATQRSFISNNEANQWIQLDFPAIRVTLTGYSIQTHKGLTNSHLKSWVVEGSIDSSRWIELDRRTNNEDLNGDQAIGSFSVSKSAQCRFIRLRQTGTNHANNDILHIRHFELFGMVR